MFTPLPKKTSFAHIPEVMTTPTHWFDAHLANKAVLLAYMVHTSNSAESKFPEILASSHFQACFQEERTAWAAAPLGCSPLIDQRCSSMKTIKPHGQDGGKRLVQNATQPSRKTPVQQLGSIQLKDIIETTKLYSQEELLKTISGEFIIRPTTSQKIQYSASCQLFKEIYFWKLSKSCSFWIRYSDQVVQK